MDASSLNGGTVLSKAWLNPVVGSLKANTATAANFVTEDPASGISKPVTSIVYASQNTLTSPVYNTGGSAYQYVDMTTFGVIGSLVPISKLVVGSTFEVYMSGSFTDNPQGTGALSFYPTFGSGDPTGGQYAVEILIPYDSIASAKFFEFRCILRVVSFTDTTITCKASYTSSSSAATSARSFVGGDATANTVTTFSRTVEDSFQLIVWVQGQVFGQVVTRDQYYVRQIA